MSIPKYQKLSNARYELVTYLNSLGAYHPTRSLIEQAIHDIDKVMKNNPTIHACTPTIGYVDTALKSTGKY
jgi:hypothetical protein